MKTSNKIILICIFIIFTVLWLIGFYFMGFTPFTIIGSISAINQLFFVEGNGIICFDACGPCSSWGTFYLFIDGKCVPPSDEACNLYDPSREMGFDGKTCQYVCTKPYQQNCIESNLRDTPNSKASIVGISKGTVITGNLTLIPETITVVMGINNTVTWINDDDTAHGIASDKGGDDSWGSPGVLYPGDSFSVTFNSTGIYEYPGVPHPWETGKVVVLEK